MNNLSFVGNNLCIDVADKNHTGRGCDRQQSTAAEQSGHGDGTGLFLWSRSDAPIRVAWRERGGAEGEGTRERGSEGGKAQLVIIIVANQAAQFRPAAVVIFTSPSCIIHWAAVIHTKCIHACHFTAPDLNSLTRAGRGGMSPRGLLARCFPLANHGPGRADHRRAK